MSDPDILTRSTISPDKMRSRPKYGVASLAYVPGIHIFLGSKQGVDGRDKPGHDEAACRVS
jgi:hypothetical protein